MNKLILIVSLMLLVSVAGSSAKKKPAGKPITYQQIDLTEQGVLYIINGTPSSAVDVYRLDTALVREIKVYTDSKTLKKYSAPKSKLKKVVDIKVYFRTKDGLYEEMPTFEGDGIEKFRKWVSDTVEYPASARDLGIEGTVRVSFTVSKEGEVTDVRIVFSPSFFLSEEVLKVVKSSPKWTPGIQNGEPVDVPYAIQISFRLPK